MTATATETAKQSAEQISITAINTLLPPRASCRIAAALPPISARRTAPKPAICPASRLQRLGAPLLLLEQTLGLFHVPRDRLAVRHPAIVRWKCAPNKTRGCRLCDG